MVEGQAVTWTERVQILRSPERAQRQQEQLEKRLPAATQAVQALTPAPGRGKRPIREEAALQEAIARVLAQHQVTGLLTVTWERQEQEITRYQGRGRGGANRPTSTAVQVRYAVTGVSRNEEALAAQKHRMGWRAQVTNAPVERLPLAAAVREGRDGWSLERDFHLVKDLPLGLSPLFVWKEDQITGLTRLLTLGLRLLTLIEIQVRQELTREEETLPGLYEGQPNRTTARPTGKRILKAFARAKITLTWVETGPAQEVAFPDHPEAGAGSAGTGAVVSRQIAHITPLSPLLEQLLHYLRLPPSLYTALAYNSS
jgi:transposase